VARVLVAALPWLATACGGPGSPAGPSSATSKPGGEPVSVSLGSLDGGVGVATATVTIGAVTQEWKGTPLTFTASRADAVHVEALGFLVRDTRLGRGVVSLFPIGPGYSDTFALELLYGAPNPGYLEQAQGPITLALDGSVAAAFGEIQTAAARAGAALGIPIDVTIGGNPTGVVYGVSLDPTLASRGYSGWTTWEGGAHLTGGSMAFADLAAARYIPLVMHECGHAARGLGHVPASTQIALMNGAIPPQLHDFTAAEKAVIGFSAMRPAGSRSPDNDVGVTTSSRAGASVGCVATLLASRLPLLE
jgi:hypothetical protein